MEIISNAVIFVNVIAVVISAFVLLYSGRKCYKLDISQEDYSFYQFIFTGSICILLANLVAFMRSYLVYVSGVSSNTFLLITLAYIDRICMTFGAFIWALHAKKYTHKWFKK